jgi:hypothetical protein
VSGSERGEGTSLKNEPDNRGQAMKMDRKVGRQAFEVDQKVYHFADLRGVGV